MGKLSNSWNGGGGWGVLLKCVSGGMLQHCLCVKSPLETETAHNKPDDVLKMQRLHSWTTS